MADWQVAAISAGAALVGALVGGMTQLAIQTRQHRAARLDARRERKRVRYSEFIDLVVQLPNLLVDASIDSTAAHEMVREFGRRYDTLRADMLLVGSRTVRDGMVVVRDAIAKAFAEWTVLSDANVAKQRDERVGFDTIMRRLFDAHVMPALDVLAERMVKELEED